MTAYIPQLAGCCEPVTTQFPFANYVMVEWFGAAADGVSDDTDAFVRALADGRPIGLAANRTYALRNVIIPPDAVCPGIFAPAGQARIVPPPSYAATDYFFAVRKADGFSFESIFFDMPANTDPVGGYAFNRAIWLQPDGLRGRNYRVERCRFAGGAVSMTGVGYIIEDSLFAGNHVSGTYGDGMSFNAMINCQIVDNVLEDGGFATDSFAPSGAIRTGTNTQLDTTLNLTIARNTISGYCVAIGQSAIDCFSGAARNIRITDNVLNLNGAGIELKTMIWTQPAPPPPGAEDVYEDNVIADNTIRLFGDRSTSAITVLHADPGAAKGKAANVKVSSNTVSSAGNVAVGAFSHYAISIQGHDNVSVSDNFIFNVGHGIAIGGIGPVGDTADYVVVSGNTVDVEEVAFQHSGGTLNHLYIRDNPVLRVGTAALGPAVIVAGAGSDIEIASNRIENLATGRQALEIREVSNARVTDNTILAQGAAVAMQGTAASGVKFRDNEVVSATAEAFNLSTGTAIEVSDNTVEVPLGFRAVAGAATYTTAGNVRGIVAANPTGTAAGSLGDIFLDGTAATAGWRCTAAGGIGATYTVI